MKPPEHPHVDGTSSPQNDELAQLAARIEHAVRVEDFRQAACLVEENIASAWFAFPESRAVEILRILVHKLDQPPALLKAAYRILTATRAGLANTRELVESIDKECPRQMYVLSIFRMVDFRRHGNITDALEQADSVDAYIEQMRPSLNPRGGWLLQSTVQVGTTAMLAGDFPKALAAFMQAQMHRAKSKFAFLEREALVKSALIHACFGNAATAQGLLKRAREVGRTSSWAEAQLDTQQEFVNVLTYSGDSITAHDRLEAINLQDIGEMWPFYIIALHRILEAAGHHDELDHRLEMLDSLPWPRVDGDGLTGSVFPLTRALVALSAGHGAEAQDHLTRADQRLTYTKVVTAAANVTAGRLTRALEQAYDLRKETRGFRLLEIRRLSVVAAAQYLSGDNHGCTETLSRATALPRGLTPPETLLFGAELHEFAEQHLGSWPRHSTGKPIFLSLLPKPGHTLTRRESQILELLTQGHSRARIAERLYISLSTVKTQLRSIYRKLEVSSAAEAIAEAERRGLN